MLSPAICVMEYISETGEFILTVLVCPWHREKICFRERILLLILVKTSVSKAEDSYGPNNFCQLIILLSSSCILGDLNGFCSFCLSLLILLHPSFAHVPLCHSVGRIFFPDIMPKKT